jgi:hypothetical protein
MSITADFNKKNKVISAKQTNVWPFTPKMVKKMLVFKKVNKNWGKTLNSTRS